MEHTPENLEGYAENRAQEEQKPVVQERPVMHRIVSWLLIAVVLFGFLGTCYWLAMYGR